MKLDKQFSSSGGEFFVAADPFFSSPPLIIHFPFISVFLRHPLPPTRARSPPLPLRTPLPCEAVTFLHPLSPY